MALTHNHAVRPDEQSTHLDSTGRQFGADAHAKLPGVGFFDHTHEDVFEEYDPFKDQINLVPFAPGDRAERESIQREMEEGLQNEEETGDRAEDRTGADQQTDYRQGGEVPPAMDEPGNPQLVDDKAEHDPGVNG